jgi:poly-gamma-glutamate capsule biosynthesis protein CapA/YwtB (metallophosphatase superfamily)
MSMIGRLARLAQTPQGRKLLREAQKVATDPKNRARLDNLRGKLVKPAADEASASPKPKPKAASGEPPA